MTKFLGISVDDTLGGNSPSDAVVSSQKAVKKYIDDHSGGGGSVDIDGKSITKNSSDELQTVGVINQRNTANAIKTWTGTKAQYDAISTKDANTIYNITDDTNPTQALLEAIYPVGSIYIGTMSVCPMSALFGTWQLVAQDRVLQGAGTRGNVGNTLNASLPNITSGTDWVNSTGGTASAAQNTTPSNDGCFVGDSTGGHGIASNQYAIYWSRFDASNSSSVYQDGAPVQQDAYLVNIWERTA